MSTTQKTNNTESSNIKYVVILGCRLIGDVPGKCLHERLKVALRFAKQNPDTFLVCSGSIGNNETITEALAMKRYFIKNGIKDERILLEEKSHSTYENFLYSKSIIIKHRGTSDLSNIAFVTNDYHVYRSRKIALLLDYVNPIGLSAYTPKSTRFDNYIRELLSLINYGLRVRPKILKDKSSN